MSRTSVGYGPAGGSASFESKDLWLVVAIIIAAIIGFWWFSKSAVESVADATKDLFTGASQSINEAASNASKAVSDAASAVIDAPGTVVEAGTDLLGDWQKDVDRIKAGTYGDIDAAKAIAAAKSWQDYQADLQYLQNNVLNNQEIMAKLNSPGDTVITTKTGAQYIIPESAKQGVVVTLGPESEESFMASYLAAKAQYKGVS